MTPDDARHGSWNGYLNLDCRCPRCRQANTEAGFKYMKAHPEQAEKHKIRAKARYVALKETRNTDER